MNEKSNYLQTEEKMFTQSELNRIISERLSRDKQKGGEELDKRESELNERELKFILKQMLAEKSLPTELAEIIKLSDEKSAETAVEMLEKYFSGKDKESKLSVINERKLPQNKNEDENYGMLRKAFGLN